MDSFKRLTLTVPYSILEIIDRVVQHRVGDGERNASRANIAMEMLKIGARIEKKKLDNIETGANPFDNRLEEQLAYIGRKVADIDLKQRKLLHIIAKANDIDADFVKRVSENVTISDNDKTVIQRLFVEISELKGAWLFDVHNE